MYNLNFRASDSFSVVIKTNLSSFILINSFNVISEVYLPDKTNSFLFLKVNPSSISSI